MPRGLSAGRRETGRNRRDEVSLEKAATCGPSAYVAAYGGVRGKRQWPKRLDAFGRMVRSRGLRGVRMHLCHRTACSMNRNRMVRLAWLPSELAAIWLKIWLA